jgi:hypothetical protein
MEGEEVLRDASLKKQDLVAVIARRPEHAAHRLNLVR